jgi:2-polyprenyl-3-methyl-5-hydroxy-6-metoxy-1,4-benzoquinol methylase
MQKLKDVFCHASVVQKFLVDARPLIHPSAPIIDCVPDGVNALDVGCGAGALLATLALNNKISSGRGVDANAAIVDVAKKAAEKITNIKLEFSVSRSISEIPPGPYDLVTLIDVMHHVSQGEQQDFFLACVDRVVPGGKLIYKDMAEKPLWKNLFNRLHDLIMARQIIHYVPIGKIKKWAESCGLEMVHESYYSRFAYGHELLAFRKPVE